MYKIVYYDVSSNQTNSSMDGTKIDIFDLIKIFKNNPETPDSIRELMESLKFDLDPRGIEKSQRWEKMMTVIIYCLSGKIPLRSEVLLGRQIILALPRYLREMENIKKISFSVLPYILIGFKSHIENEFHHDSNKIKDVANFISRLHESNNPRALSFLCAHRESGSIEKLILVNSIHKVKTGKALNLIKGILANTQAKSRTIHWYQQGGTKQACMNMFPEMFIKYMEGGKMLDLIKLLDSHFNEISSLISQNDQNFQEIKLFGLDSVINEVTNFICNNYCKNWQNTDFSKFKKDELVSLALDVTLPHIIRLMPFYSSHILIHQDYLDKKESYIQKNVSGTNSFLIKKVIERFFESQMMHPTAKAMYETTFYYLWGKHCAENNDFFSIGIDRDHDNFQYLAWRKGFLEIVENEAVPLIYGRRTKENGLTLSSYNLRQFWR